MSTRKRKVPRTYCKVQTKWSRRPAVIGADRHTNSGTVRIQLWPEAPFGAPYKSPAQIWLTPHEAQSFAAWLCEQAETLLATEARKEAKRLARLAAKNSPEAM
jgi:hypothetical protein